MKKPKKKYSYLGDALCLTDEEVGRNQVIDEYDRFLPSEKEINKIIADMSKEQLFNNYPKQFAFCNRKALAKAISKRIGTNKEV